jgi:hypothetical protein
MQVPILAGITSDGSADYRTYYPRNMIPVPKAQGVSSGYLRPAPGIISTGTGVGNGRGGINWNDTLYRVSGSKLIRVNADGTTAVIGDVMNDGAQVSMDRSFDRLMIASAGSLFYYDGTKLEKVDSPNLGLVLDCQWIAGYTMTTDGTNILTSDLNDPTSFSTLHYGSSEADPDKVVGVRKLRNEAYAINRFTIEAFENIGGDNFPFQVIPGATVPKGAISAHVVAYFQSSIAFVGGGRTKEGPEPPAVWLMVPGDSQKLSTREIETQLQEFTEAQLATCVLEARSDRENALLYLHLPDRCLVYDANASTILGEPIWHILTTSLVGYGQYRARSHVWCYDRWNVDDPTSSALGRLDSSLSSHYGMVNGWDFGTLIVYNEGNAAIFNELELIGLTGRAPVGADPTIWTSYSVDGVTWSQERPRRAGKTGDRAHRIVWRRQGKMQFERMQRFRGTSDCHASFSRLEADLEALSV